jgi:hypothetical protein
LALNEPTLIVEQKETVTFHEAGDIAKETFSDLAPMEIKENIDDKLENSVVGFLSRPIPIYRFQLNQTAAAGATVATVALPGDWIAQPMIFEKLQGFRYLRADFTIKVQVNAQPFNAGMLILWFNPLQQMLGNTPSQQLHFGGVTGYKRVFLDINTDTAAELTIPYNINLSHIDMQSGFGGLGQVFISVYSPLTGLAEVDGIVWVTASNIRVTVPTGLSLTPAFTDPEKVTAGVDHVNLKQEKAKAGSSHGVVQRTAGIVSEVAGALTSVPIVSNVASAVGWIADAVGGVASIFGWSKPITTADVTAVVPRYVPDLANHAGVSQAKVLAMDATNSIDQAATTSITNEDEMSLAHLLSKDIFTDRFTMSKTQTQGAVLWAWPVSPVSCRKNVTLVNRYCLNTMLSYLSNIFRYWRGSIKYKFRIIKTVFHSGRFRLIWVPGANEATNPLAVDLTKCYSQIIDLRDTHEFDFEIPYVWNEPWNPTAYRSSKRVGFTVCDAVPTGMIYVDVVNALRNPATAADQIEIIVESSGGADFEFGFPALSNSVSLLHSANFLMNTKYSNTTTVLPLRPASTESYVSPPCISDVEKPDKISIPEIVVDPVTVVKPVTVLPDSNITQAGQTIETTEVVRDVPRISWYRWKVGDKLMLSPTNILDEASREDGLRYPMFASERYKQWVAYVQEDNSLDNKDWATAYYTVFEVPVEGKDQMNIPGSDDTPGVQIDRLTMGEKITSLRQVLKRKEEVGAFIKPTGPAASRPTIFRPCASGFSSFNGTEASALPYTWMFDWVMALYRWQKGSIQLGFTTIEGDSIDATPSNHTKQFWLVPTRDVPGASNPGIWQSSGGVIDSADVLVPNGQPEVLGYIDAEKFIEISVPHYKHLTDVPTDIGQPAMFDYEFGNITKGTVPNDYGPIVVVRTDDLLWIWRSIGEDFSFSYSLGPPITYSSVVAEGKTHRDMVFVNSYNEILAMKSSADKTAKLKQFEAFASEQNKRGFIQLQNIFPKDYVFFDLNNRPLNWGTYGYY